MTALGTSEDQLRRFRKESTFREWLDALIDFAMHDGANGCPPGRSFQTKDAAKRLRAAYRDALNAAAKEE